MLFRSLFSLFYCLRLINSSNFSQLHRDELNSISVYLPNKERQSNFRYINVKCNDAIKQINNPMIDNLIQLQHLFQSLQHQQLTNDSINTITKIHNAQRFNEYYSLKLVKLLHESHCILHQETHINPKIMQPLASTLKFGSLYTDPTLNLSEFQQLDVVTKALIESSREITTHLIFGSKDLGWIHSMKLMYQFCFEYLSNSTNAKLPSMESIYYFDDNLQIKHKEINYLTHVMDSFGLLLLHKKHTDIPWNIVDLNLYMGCYWEMITMINDDDNEYMIRMFDAKFVMKILENTDILQNSAKDSISYREFNQILHRAVHYFYDMGPNDIFDSLLSHLRRNKAVKMLRFYGILQIMLRPYSDRYRYINLLAELCYDTINGDNGNVSDHILNEQRCKIIAKSTYLWFSKGRGYASMMEITKLANDKIFDPYSIGYIIKIYIVYDLYAGLDKMRASYLQNIINNLCNLRHDWDFGFVYEYPILLSDHKYLRKAMSAWIEKKNNQTISDSSTNNTEFSDHDMRRM